MTDYNGVAVTDETTLAQRQEAPPAPGGSAFAGMELDADAARGVAEVLGAITVARKIGRNENDAFREMRRITDRHNFCKRSMYSYRRGGQLVEGASIDLVEQLSRIYGHIRAGWRELERSKTEAKVEAFAWDMLSNTHTSRQFVVPFRRDKSGVEGGVELTEQRDRYELMANFAARRMRSCIEQILPADFVDEALERVRATLERGDGAPLADRIREMTLAFEEFGVRGDDIAARLGHNLDVITPAQLVGLRNQYNAIRSGGIKAQELFPRVAVHGDPASSSSAATQQAAGTAPPAASPPPASTDADPAPPADPPPSEEDPPEDPAPEQNPASAKESENEGEPEAPEVAAEVLAEAQRLGLDLDDPDLEAKVAAAKKPKAKKKTTGKKATDKKATQGSLV